MSNWWQKNSKKIPLHIDEFRKLITFFVFNCPVRFKNGRKVSQRAVTFEERGIIEDKLSGLLNYLKRRIKHKDCIKCCVSEEEIVSFERSCRKRYPKETNVEFLAYIENRELYKTRTVFYQIRNAFAHGSFSIVDSIDGSKYYYMESSKDDKIKGRICLKEATLLRWLDKTEELLKK